MAAMPRHKFQALGAAVATLAIGQTAAADGAFPDSMGLFLPADRPQELILVTNFGLVISEDDGQHWYLTCEIAIGSYVAQYQMGAPPNDLLYARGTQGLAYSTDAFCTQTYASGVLDNALVFDAFADPSNPLRVLAVAAPFADGSFGAVGVYESNTGAASFSPSPLYAAPSGYSVNGVEIARSDTNTIYVATTDPNGNPFLLQSANGGQSFTTYDESAVLGPFGAMIAAVDPKDSQKVYLRVVSVDANNDDELAITTNGGASVTVPLKTSGQMTMLYVRSDGAIIVSTFSGTVYISTDGGMTFTVWQGAPRFRALGERGGVLYGVGQNAIDPFAVGMSTDNGATWKPLLSFSGICGLASCPRIQAACAGEWATLVKLFGIPADACATSDAGAPGADSGSDSGAAIADAGTIGRAKSCSCSSTDGWAVAACLLALGVFRSARWQRGQAGRRG
jgi:photosystem II stability/assembly factor-like uncharacterized protein